MNIANLVLISCPAMLALILMLANPASANKTVAQPTNTETPASAQPIFEVVFEQEPSESPMLEFTDEEADAAIDKFGCDCSGCINSIRQLQGQLPLLER